MTEKNLVMGFCDQCANKGTFRKVWLYFDIDHTVVYCPKCGQHVYGHPAKNEK